MNQYKYTVPSRISMTLIDMNGNLGRIDGSCGFSLTYPRLIFTVKTNYMREIVLTNTDIVDTELIDTMNNSLHVLQDKYHFGGATFTFQESIPTHMGFGSKTATLLSTAHAYGKIYNHDFMFNQLALELGRGGTSGLGVNIIDRGGFILEGGHSTKIKKDFLPSSRATQYHIAPVLARYEMPNWEFLLVVPKADKTFYTKELNFFQNICPIDQPDISGLCRIIFSQILPAVVESERDVFSQGVDNINKCTWKKGEINIYGQRVMQEMENLRKLGLRGIGMSSIGTCIYALGSNLPKVKEQLLTKNPDLYHFVEIVKPQNSGVKIE